MKKLTANFFPAEEQKNGYIGKANITIADAIRINGISVFAPESGGISISFPEFGEGENRRSYVVPKSKEAYEALLAVVAKAVSSDKHFGFTTGEYGPHMEVHGKAVNEPYADARFSIEVEDICVLYGLTTRVVDYEKDGKDRSFVSVDKPTIATYKDKEGNDQYRPAFEGRVSVWKDREGVEQKRDWGQLMQGLVLAERKNVLERKPALEDQVKNAEARTAPAQENTAPAKER